MLRFAATRVSSFRARGLLRAIAPIALFTAACVGGCYSNQKGIAPPESSLYFPTGLALANSRGGACPGSTCGSKWLFALNSNFDLRYDSGWLAAIDLDAVVGEIDSIHADKGQTTSCRFDPTNVYCGSSDSTKFIRSAVRFGSFGADVLATKLYDATGNPLDRSKGRLLIPVRGDASLTIVDFDETSPQGITLHCAPRATENSFDTTCGPAWRIGNDATKTTRGIALEGEPFSIAVPSYWPNDLAKEPERSGGIAAIVHQSQGDVSVFLDVNMLRNAGFGAAPSTHLVYTLGGGALPAGGTSIAPLDIVSQNPADAFTPRFLVTNQTQPGVYQISYFGDQGTRDRSALFVDGAIPILTNSAGYDSRGVVVDPPNAGETRPMRIFVTNRTPPSLVVGNLDPTLHGIRFYGNVPLPIGPSRISRAVVPALQSDGTVANKTRIFAASFDGRWLVVIDPDRPTDPIVDVVRTGRGPYALAIDPDRRLGFVTNFTESTVQVIELDPVDPNDPSGKSPNPLLDQVLFTIGVPTLPAF